MSEAGLELFTERLSNDQQLRERFLRDPNGASAGFDLSPKERQAAATLVQFGFAPSGAKQGWFKRYDRGTLRDAGVVLLSLFLLLLLTITAAATFLQLSAPPVTYTVGGNEQAIDTFDRAKDLLIVFFPLFSAVVTFWLGTAVEGRHTEKREQEAEEAQRGQKQAETEVVQTRFEAQSWLSQVKFEVLETYQVMTTDLSRTPYQGEYVHQTGLGAEESGEESGEESAEEYTGKSIKETEDDPGIDRLLNLLDEGINAFR